MYKHNDKPNSKEAMDAFWREQEELIKREGRDAVVNLWFNGWVAGLHEGSYQGQSEIVSLVLEERFEAIDIDGLCRIVDPLLELPEAEMARLILTASREELLERFKKEILDYIDV
ncbi:hypothetical protein [Argonema antarcticum]|uniref:hypothetical protein n=1 Tax=Argonema antarcticum TaxID=2942763 RepID=UPI002012771D|nr:hypothetical protein [Argonema antarcticum]MCL1471193.1 hypothetical protein [Argonema antarcticum A004/B2]